MPDMLVKLYELPDLTPILEELKAHDIEIRRAMPPNKSQVVTWVLDNFGEWWASETDVAMNNKPVSCFLAVRGGTDIVGFACYESTCKDFFGPTGVLEECRGKGVGKALLLAALWAMRNEGYAYAIIGGTESANPFYEKIVGATVIEGSAPGIFGGMLGWD